MNRKHILHIVRKDFRAQRFHLILWGILLALYVAILSQWELGEPAGASVVTILVHLLPGVVIVYGLVIVVTLIHQDSVAGTSAFWLTRPVRGPSLFAAKAIEAAAMGALWFCADILVLAGNGVAGHTGYLAFGVATGLLPVMLVVLAIAALSPNTQRFFLSLALTTVGISLIAMVLNLVTSWFIVPDAAAEVRRTLGESLSSQVVGGAIASLGALAILGWQFLTRRTGVSIVAALIVGVGAAVAFSSWSHNFFQPRVALGDPSAQFEAVKMVIDSSDLRSGYASVGTGDDDPIEYRTVSGLTTIHGLPDGVLAEWDSARTRVITADGHEFLQHPDSGYNYQSGAGISAALDGAALNGSTLAVSKGGSWWRAIVRTDDNEFEQFAHQPCRLESEIRLKLYRYDLIGELSLEKGSEVRHDDLRVRIINVLSRPDTSSTSNADESHPDAKSTPYECEVEFSKKYPNSSLKAALEGGNLDLYSDLTYVLVNRQENEAIFSNGGGSSSYGGMRMMFHFGERRLKFHPADGSKRSARFNKAWFDGATLAILKRRSLGEITRTATLENVVFE